MANNNKYIGSGRVREGGAAALHRVDFKYHTDGTGWRHNATQIDMKPPIPVLNNIFNGATAQETLEKMAYFFSTIGQNYITIGDGYDTGDYNAPPLDNAFNEALTNPRLQNGGVILIKSGTYRLSSTITIPPGITVMGEPRGTYIFGQMGENPMFHVERSVKQFRIGTLDATPLYTNDTTDQVKFYNLVLGDNTDGYYTSGGVPVATMSTVPFIEAEVGSNILIERIVFLGYLNAGLTPIICSHRAVSYVGSAPSEPTTLHIDGCLFDGLKSAVEFTPTEGRINNLRVEKSRAYLLGNPASGDVEDTCFVSFNLCNAHFEGNQHYGLGNLQDRCFAILATSVADPNVRVNFINNSGGLSDALAYTQDELSNFVTSANSQTFESVNIGNNWGLNLNNDFFYIVGDGVNSVGDLVGPNALDIAILRSEVGSGLTGANGSVIVNAGDYVMTQGSLDSKVNLIGNVKEGRRPRVTLNSLSGATDQAGNPTQGVGHYVSGIQFLTDAANFQSITVVEGTGTGNDRTQVVRDCRFIDCGLFFEDVTQTLPYKINQIIDSCYFVQTNAKPNNVSFYTNGANNVLLENCTFTGYGYVGGIGSASPFASNMQSIVVSNCQMFMNDDGLNAKRLLISSPLNISRYFFVYNIDADVEISNCSIRSVEEFSSAADVIDGPIAVDGDCDKFIEIIGRNVKISNSTIIGSSNLYDDGGTDYQLPTLFVEPSRNLYIDSTFIEGILPLQVSGANAFSNGTNNLGNIYLNNSEFIGFVSGATGYTSTCIDIDVPLLFQGVVLNPLEIPKIVINNCSVQNIRRTSGINEPLRHINNTGAYFNAIGILMIFAPGWTVNMSGTTISGRMDDAVSGALVNTTGAVIDCYGTSGASGKIGIDNCRISLSGFQNSGTVAETMLTCLLRAPALSFNNNHVSLRTGTAGGSTTNYNSYLWISNDGGSTEGMSNVSGNMFLATNAALGLAAVVIDPNTEGRGIFVDNVFSHIETSSALNTLVFLNATGTWNFERNKNQTNTIRLKGNRGVFGFGREPVLRSLILADFASVDAAFISFSDVFPVAGTSAQVVVFGYAPGANDLRYVWEISLDEALPNNVYVLNATVNIEANTLFDTTGDFAVQLYSTANPAGTYVDTADLTVDLIDTLVVTPASPETEFKTGLATLTPALVISLDADDTVASPFVTVQVDVTYRW